LKRCQDISIFELAFLEMGRLKKGQEFSPLEVLQWIFPEAWEHFVPDVILEIERMHQDGKILIKQYGFPPNFPLKNINKVKISVKI